MTMSIGINTNVKYQGKIYHIQTEDGGANHPAISTLLFKDGVVYASRKTDYKDLLQSPSCRETVSKIMKEQHKSIIRELVSGKILSSTPDPEEASVNQEKSHIISAQDAGKNAIKEVKPHTLEKDLDDLILDYLSEKEKDLD
ncbi:MAG: hypothetical protein ACE5GK_03580 [Nitrospiria bacterium]